MRVFTLYGTSACHLCELAQAMLEAQSAATGDFVYQLVDISDSEALFERYGILIPVLQHPDDRELKWPFTPEDLDIFLRS